MKKTGNKFWIFFSSLVKELGITILVAQKIKALCVDFGSPHKALGNDIFLSTKK